MQIVIDIPEEEYQNYLKMRPAYPDGVFCYIEAIQNGTPLTESYERLVEEIERVVKEYSDMSLREYRGGLYKAMEIIDKHISGKEKE